MTLLADAVRRCLSSSVGIFRQSMGSNDVGGLPILLSPRGLAGIFI